MNEDQQLRLEALSLAARTPDETPADHVTRAEAYHAFLTKQVDSKEQDA